MESSQQGTHWLRWHASTIVAATTVLMTVALTGCASSGRPNTDRTGVSGGEIGISIPAGQYGGAFDTAVAEARRLGFEPQLLDRRAGLIEAGPARSATALEPWAWASDSGENTLHQQRRILKVSFQPEGISQSVERASDPLVGPITDLTTLTTPLRMVVTVSVQRQQRPIDHRAIWSLATRSEAWQHDPATGNARKATWRTVRRDSALELRFAARCEVRIADS